MPIKSLGPRCSVAGCPRAKVAWKTCCYLHEAEKRGIKCIIEGCEKWATHGNRCSAHYAKAWKAGKVPSRRFEDKKWEDVIYTYTEHWVPRRTTPVLPAAMSGSLIPAPTYARLTAGR